MQTEKMAHVKLASPDQKLGCVYQRDSVHDVQCRRVSIANIAWKDWWKKFLTKKRKKKKKTRLKKKLKQIFLRL